MMSLKKIKNGCDMRKIPKDKLPNYKTNIGPESPFKEKEIMDASFLDCIEGRSICPKCQKSRKYFCYTCYMVLPEFKEFIPKIKIPCAIDIIKHPKETDGKSTAIHAKLIAPDDTRILTYPDIPDYKKEKNVFLVFPDDTSLSTEEFDSFIHDERRPIINTPQIRAIFIDSTWNQTKRIRNDERLLSLPCIRLNAKETLFWRYQTGKPKTYLSTIEAIYYFLIDLHTQIFKWEYNSEYDNLLFFFKFMYEKIHSLYNPEKLLAYKDELLIPHSDESTRRDV